MPLQFTPNRSNAGSLIFASNPAARLMSTVVGPAGAPGTGDVDGPLSSTDNSIARFDATTGKLLQNSGVIIDDVNNIAGANTYTSSTTQPTITAQYPSFSDPANTYLSPNTIQVTWNSLGVSPAFHVESVAESTAEADGVLGGSVSAIWGGTYIKTDNFLDPAGIIGVIGNKVGLVKSTGAAIWGIARIKGGQGASECHLLRGSAETDGTDHPNCGLYITSSTVNNAVVNGAFIASALSYGFVTGSAAALTVPTYSFAHMDGSNNNIFWIDSATGGVHTTGAYYIGSAKFADLTAGFNIIYAPNGTGQAFAADNSNAIMRGDVQSFTNRSTSTTFAQIDGTGVHANGGLSFIAHGATSGAVFIKAPAVAGSNILTLPAGTTDFSATGGAGQVVKQTSAGGPFTVAAVAASDISGAALTKTDDTNVTATLGGSPTTALLAATSITLGWTGVLSAARGGTGFTTGARERLVAARTYFVRGADGSDSNTGLVDTAGGAFATIQKAYDIITSTLDLGGQAVTVQVRAHTYTAGLSVTQPWTGGGSVTFQGAGATTHVDTSAGASSAFFVDGSLPGILTLLDMKGTPGGFPVIWHRAFGEVQFNGITCGVSTNAHFFAEGRAVLSCVGGAYEITGAAATHYSAVGGGTIFPAGATVTVTGTPAFPLFAFASRLSLIRADGMTFVGAATGTRYSVTENSVIYTGGGGANYFPGNAAGSTATGGQYI